MPSGNFFLIFDDTGYSFSSGFALMAWQSSLNLVFVV